MPGGYSIERQFRQIRNALPEQLRAQVVRCPTPYHSPLWLLKGLARARAAAAEVNHILGDVHYVALGLPGERTILTVHDLIHLAGLRGWRRSAFKWLYYTLPLRRCRFVTAVSEHTRRCLTELFPFAAGKVVVIPDCVPDGFWPKPKPFDENCPRILQVGTASHKNLERTACAVAGIRCVLHVIGPLSPAQRTLLEALSICYENSVALADDALVRAYEEADVVVFASLAEGFGVPIIEAQAVGRPVVTSNLPPMNEVAGAGACLVNPHSVESIRNGLLRVMQDGAYRKQLVEEGFHNAARFSPEWVAAQYTQLYEQVRSSYARSH